MKRLIDTGVRKVYKNFNILKILSKLDELQLIIYKQKLKDEDNQWILKHSKANVINCNSVNDDSDFDGCSSSNSSQGNQGVKHATKLVK